MIFDTHCHYNLPPLYGNWQEHWQKAQDHQVKQAIIVGTDLETSKVGLEIAQTDMALRASVGLHPSEYQELVTLKQFSLSEVDSLVTEQMQTLNTLLSNPKTAAIGETGLDYYRLPTDKPLVETIKQAQLLGFEAHLKLAQSAQLPVIIHVRDQGEAAYYDVLETLKKFAPFSKPFILHCVSGPTEYIKAALELGAYLGIAGNMTYNSAEHLRNLVKLAPKDKLVLETDAPFLPPQEFRGKVCEPWMISLTAEFAADELALDLDQLYQNAETVFN